MEKDNLGNIVIIISSIIVAIIVLIGVIIILDKYFLGKRRCKRQYKEAERNFSYYKSVLSNKDYQVIQRLQIISGTNLVYSDVYSTFYTKYNEIKDNEEKAYIDVLDKLNKYLSKSDVKKFKKLYRDSEIVFKNYEDSVNTFNDEIMMVIKPEEEANHSSMDLKDLFKELKSKYNANEEELQFVNDTFVRVFDQIDQHFIKFSKLIDQANYEEANSILPVIKNVIDVCNDLIDKTPIIIKRVIEIVPQEIEEINEHYNILINKQFPLKHLKFEELNNECDSTLNKLRKDLKELKISHIDEKLNEIENKINLMEEFFLKEEENYLIFNENSERIYDDFNKLEDEFIVVKNNLNKYSKYYIVDDNHLNELEQIHNELEDVSKDKRRLDNYIHSLVKTPYSNLVEKMKDLETGTFNLNNHFSKFKDYLASLKTDTEESFNYINENFFNLKEHEAYLRNFFNEEYSNKFNSEIDKCYKLIDDVYNLLKTVPINVNKVLETRNELEEKINTLFTRIDNDVKYRDLTEKEIMFMNKERVKFSDVNVQLLQAESLFINGDFEQAFQACETISKQIEDKDNLEN